MLSSALNSETATVGSAVSATLTNDFIYNGKLIASRGSVLNGTIVKAKKRVLETETAKFRLFLTI